MLLCAYLDDLSQSEKQILSYALEHPKEVLAMDMGDLAELTFVSKTSVYRMVKKMGLNGFDSFKKELAEECDYLLKMKEMMNVDFPFAKGEEITGMIKDLTHLYLSTIRDTADLLKSSDLQKAAHILQDAHHICVLGVYGGGPIGKVFGLDMRMVGRCVRYLNVNVPCVKGLVNEDDVVIVLSYHDIRIEEHSVFSYIKESGAKIIAISSLGINNMKEWADVFLPVSSFESPYTKIKAFASQLSMMMVLNVLFACYFQKDYDVNVMKRAKNARAVFY